MTTRTENELFTKQPRRHLLADLAIVALVAALTAGFIAQALRPGPAHDPRATVPAAVFTQS